jgi:hypothetical protein
VCQGSDFKLTYLILGVNRGALNVLHAAVVNQCFSADRLHGDILRFYRSNLLTKHGNSSEILCSSVFSSVCAHVYSLNCFYLSVFSYFIIFVTFCVFREYPYFTFNTLSVSLVICADVYS